MTPIRFLITAAFATTLMVNTAFAADDDLRVQAKEKATTGLTLMQSNKYVDAALSYADALKLYEKIGDVDGTCEMQANVYWCKKKMNVDDIQAYVAHKGGGGDAKAVAARIEAVADKQVSVDKAQEYFDRAQAFEKKQPDKTLQIAIRYFEVAQRFKDDPLGAKAQELCFKYQEKLTTELAKKADDVQKAEKQLSDRRESYFTRKSTAPGSAELPDANTQRKAVADLKQIYAADYKSARTEDKRALAGKLYAAAEKSKDEPSMRWALLNEAMRLGKETEHYWVVLRASDALAATFAGFDAAAEKKKALQSMGGKLGAAQVVKLLDDPSDPTANAAVGRMFCVSGEWADGLAMLAAGNDADAKKIADMELAGPTTAGQQAEIGDGWYDLGKKAKTPFERDAFLNRCRTWYQKCEKTIEGVSKARVAQRLTEIDKLIPPPITDWNKLTVNQWESLKGVIVVVDAKKTRIDTGITMAPGRPVRVVPHPTETYTISRWSSSYTCTWRGNKRAYSDSDRFEIGEICAWVGQKGQKTKCLVPISGEGPLVLAPYNDRDDYYSYYGEGDKSSGAIRVKIIAAIE
jgi:hypothetical protein